MYAGDFKGRSNYRMRKNILFVLSLLFGSVLFAQDSLPEANRKILEFVNTQIGKKVKTGVCFDLVKGALDVATPGWDKRKKRKWIFFKTYEFVYGKRVCRKKIMPGDVVLFEWEPISGINKHRTKHVCIIYSIDKDGNIKIAEQNTEGTLKKSIVEINNFDTTGKDWGAKVYKLRFYRAY